MLSALVVHPIRLLGALLIGTGVISGLVYSVLSINQISLRQRITPIHLLGRVTAARREGGWGRIWGTRQRCWREAV